MIFELADIDLPEYRYCAESVCPTKRAGGRGYAPASQRVLNNKRTRRSTDTDTESAEEVAE